MPSCNLFSQHMVHEALESPRGILQSRPHNSWFKEATGCQESTLVLVLCPDLHGWETSFHIDLGKDSCPLEHIHSVLDKGEGVLVLD